MPYSTNLENVNIIMNTRTRDNTVLSIQQPLANFSLTVDTNTNKISIAKKDEAILPTDTSVVEKSTVALQSVIGEADKDSTSVEEEEVEAAQATYAPIRPSFDDKDNDSDEEEEVDAVQASDAPMSKSSDIYQQWQHHP
ncbi:hypothetical protein CHS0354_030018 [Potamilus streckersoni]|uniref:Uncharacterized protein n=1 Tax=Potamilus streckersoni TaxID=2493646 RepID=A0AAE0SEB8_9BIVA|nr:hypothetical protein CHS0354_030018 [Potamilus streckersoni]